MTSSVPSGSGAEAGADGFLTAGAVTAQAVTEDFLATRGSLATRRAYGTAISGFFRTAGITWLAELHPEARPPAEVAKLVRAYLDTVTKRTAAEPWRILNPATVNARAEALRAFFAWMMAAYGYPLNPVAVAHASLPTARLSATASLTRGELRGLLQTLAEAARREEGERALRDYLLVALLFGLALRRSEAAGLQWDDIDFGGETLSVARGGGRQALPRKLAGLLAEQAKQSGGGCYVFRALRAGPGKDGQERPLSAQAVFRIVRTAAERAVPGKLLTPQGLRKTFIELALAEGEPLEAISNATGHARPEFLHYYAGGRKLRENAIHTVAGKYL